MNQVNKTFLAIAIVLGSVIAAQLINPSFSSIAAAATGGCGCGCATEAAPCETCVECQADSCEPCQKTRRCTKKRGCKCKRCRKPRAKVCCPSCTTECDTCTLELDHYEAEKTCFQSEQKTICIPPVRFPWEKCCPPGRTSKTRTVNVLKIHKYKCKACGYKWKLDPLPEPCATPEPTEAVAEPAAETTSAQPTVDANAGSTGSNIDPVVAPVENGVLMPGTEAPQPGFEPAVNTPVPSAPAN